MEEIFKNLSMNESEIILIKESLQSYIYTAKIILKEAINKNQKIYIFGNGIHAIHAEKMVFSINMNHKSNIAQSISSDISVLTHLANEFGFDSIFEKQIAYSAKQDDILVGLSTFGTCKNVLRALSLGKHLGCKTIGISYSGNSVLGEFSDLNILIPSSQSQIAPSSVIFDVLTHLIVP